MADSKLPRRYNHSHRSFCASSKPLCSLARAVRCKRSGNFKLKTARNVRREMSCVIGGISGLKLETSLRRYRFSQRPQTITTVTKRMVPEQLQLHHLLRLYATSNKDSTARRPATNGSSRSSQPSLFCSVAETRPILNLSDARRAACCKK